MTDGSRFLVVVLLGASAVAGFAAASSAASGLAVLALAVIPALFAVPPPGRPLVGSAVLIAAVLVAATSDGSPELASWLAVAGLLLAGSVTVWRGRSWAPLGSRFHDTGAAGQTTSADPADLWKALDRGDDPTDRSGESGRR